MMAQFCETAFNVNGTVIVTMTDDRRYVSDFPQAAFKWLQGKDWAQVVVYDRDFDQSYGWDRF